MKKIFSLVIILFIIAASLTSCGGSSAATLESMKTALTEAGYEVHDFDSEHLPFDDHIKNISSSLIFSCPKETAERGYTFAFSVFEFKNNSSARRFINALDSDEIRKLFPRNGKFVAGPFIGLTETINQAFLEKLVNGEYLPRNE